MPRRLILSPLIAWPSWPSVKAQYSLMLNERGGVNRRPHCLSHWRDADFLLVVNAAKIEEDAAWLRVNAVPRGISFVKWSADFAALAV